MNIAQQDRVAQCEYLPQVRCSSGEELLGASTAEPVRHQLHGQAACRARRPSPGRGRRVSLIGPVMIDTERLFDSLSQATEFTVTEDHLKHLRTSATAACTGTPAKAPAAGPISAPKALRQLERRAGRRGDHGAPDSDLQRLNDDDDEVVDRYLRLHVEAGIALKIVLATGEFRSGRYTRTDSWRDEWRRA